MAKKQLIPLFDLSLQHQQLRAEILSAIANVIDKNELTYGPDTDRFEKSFAQLAGTKYAVGVRSGTASLILALQALGVGPGDEVITTPVTFAATADSISLLGARPVFADVESEYGTIDPTEVEKKITTKTRAVLIVHLYGVPCQMEQLVELCRVRKLSLVEDCSHAHGSLYRGQPVGSFGVAGCFSLYPAKTLGSVGNAGVVTGSDQQYMQRVRSLAHHGIREGHPKYTHFEVGCNELIDNIQAAVMNVKLPQLSEWIMRKRQIAERYTAAILMRKKTGVGDEFRPMHWPTDTLPSLYVYALQVEEREAFRAYMLACGVETGVYYPTPLHLQPSYADLGYKIGDFPHAEKWMNQTVSLPLYPQLTEQQIVQVEKALRAYGAVQEK